MQMIVRAPAIAGSDTISPGNSSPSQLCQQVPVLASLEGNTIPGIIDRNPLILLKMRNHGCPGNEKGLAGLSRALAELDRKVPDPPGSGKEIRDGVHLVDILLVGMEVLGKIEFLVNDGLAFNGEVISRVEGVYQHIDILAREFMLLEAVGEALDVVCCKKTVQAVDNLPLKITHWIMMGCEHKKNRQVALPAVFAGDNMTDQNKKVITITG